jgi:hypothetical protein
MKVLIQRTDHGEYWRRGTGWVARRDSATAYKGVVEAVDCCIQNTTGEVDIVLEFGRRQTDVRLRHRGT